MVAIAFVAHDCIGDGDSERFVLPKRQKAIFTHRAGQSTLRSVGFSPADRFAEHLRQTAAVDINQSLPPSTIICSNEDNEQDPSKDFF